MEVRRHIWKKTSEIDFSPIFLSHLFHQIYSFAILNLFFFKSNTGLFLFLIHQFSTQMTSTQLFRKSKSKMLVVIQEGFLKFIFSVCIFYVSVQLIQWEIEYLNLRKKTKNLRFYNTYFHLRMLVKNVKSLLSSLPCLVVYCVHSLYISTVLTVLIYSITQTQNYQGVFSSAITISKRAWITNFKI